MKLNMKLIQNIFLFFKKIFGKNDNIKMIEAPIEPIQNEERKDFLNSLKVNIVKGRKKKVETLICVGDGLGIQNKIDY